MKKILILLVLSLFLLNASVMCNPITLPIGKTVELIEDGKLWGEESCKVMYAGWVEYSISFGVTMNTAYSPAINIYLKHHVREVTFYGKYRFKILELRPTYVILERIK